MKTETIRVALFGNGFARSVILPCLRQVEGLSLAGMASRNRARAEETAREFGIERVAADHREILAGAKPDLVFVVTPPHRHAEMAIDALEAGCHVVCEKPTALNAEESGHMLAAAARHPKQIAVIDHELRFLPSRVALAKLLSSATLGHPRLAEYTLYSQGRRSTAVPWSWWSNREQGGGVLGAIGSHAVDSLRVLLGEITAVRGLLETFVREREEPVPAASGGRGRMLPVTSDDVAAAWLRFSSGTLATMTLSSVAGERVHRIAVSCSLGAATLEEQGALREVRETPDGGLGSWSEVAVSDDLPPSSTLGIPDTDWARAFLRFARALASAIREGSTTVERAATFEDGHRNQQVLDAIRRSDREGGWVAPANR
jgi:predicted dehydrogenase